MFSVKLMIDPFLRLFLIQRWHDDTGPGCPQSREVAVTQTLLINFLGFAWKMSLITSLLSRNWDDLCSNFPAGTQRAAEHLSNRKVISDHHYTVAGISEKCSEDFYTDAITSKAGLTFRPVRMETETGSARRLQPCLPEQSAPTSSVSSRSSHSVRKLSGSVNLNWYWRVIYVRSCKAQKEVYKLQDYPKEESIK